ncbi:hypothetical protein EV179_002393 [Coemansia sp. RSA 487]|nr:hypothetical protein EV179_002393 [Coemansia sp. RSA 487]
MKKPPRTRNVRRVPILGLRLLIDFMLNNLVPRYEYMISDMDFFVPFVEKSPHDTSKCWVERFPGMDDQTLADIQSIKVHTYDSLRYLMLDCDLDSGRFFIDILRLSLQVFSDTSSLGVPNDNFDLGLVLDTNYSVCLGSLTIVRIWLASKEEYRPVHLLTDRNDAHMLSNVIADYAEHVYGLLDWLVEDNTWDEKKCLILGIFGLGGQVDEMVLKLRDLYSTKTSWTNHLNVWCNVLHALTIARGRHILNVEERVLIQESMFSGQRQRKGLSKVDAYLNRMKVPTYHLEMDDLHDILGTATPFNTTSNLVWDTMRLVFDNVKSAAQKECDSAEKIASLLKESSGKTWSASSGALEHLSQTPCGIYTRIIASNPKALVQIGNNINKDILIQVQSRKTAPQRVYRMQSSRNRNAEASQHEPQTVLAPLEKAQSHNIESAKAKNKTVQRNTADVPKKPSIWHKIKQPFRKGKSSVVSAQPRDRYLESADISRSNLPPSADQNNEINSYRTSTEASRKAPDKVKTNNTRNRAALLQSPARDYDRQHMPVASWEGMSTQSRSSSMVSVTMERHIQQPHPVGPAFISAELPGTHLNVKQAYHHHSKTGLRSTSSTDSQKTEVAISNAKAAAALLGDISTRIWQLEGIWVDFHISEFVYTQNNTVKDLQKMWLVWVHLLGNPIDADETHSKIILRGMVMSWDVYRAVLDCSRYAPDNDDVMLNTSWWIAEMATIYSIDDYRGRLAQLAMFRIGCHGSDHISSRKDHAINIDQVQVFLVECKLVLSLGISGSQLMLLTIYRGLRRIFLYHSTYEGVFSDQAIQSAATLLVSMTTMLGVTRVLSLNHHLEKAQKLFECNMVDDAEIQGMFSNVKDGVERCEYPIIYDPLGSRQYRAEWVWTRNLTMHIMKAIAEHFDRSAHNVTIGKAVVIREMITLLTTIIIKTPELITREDSHVEGADARSIRDFLIEKVILSCADPTSERTGNEHRFNQRLVQEYSNHGLVLKLVQAQYSTSKSMSMEEFMTKSEDEHRYSGNAIESIKQAGEVLYVTLLQQFDEFDRSRYQGAPGSDFDKTHIDPIVQEDFSSNRVYFYAHNSGILKVYSEPDSEQSLFRDILSLDRIHANETIKIALLYVGPGQWSETEILSNTPGDTSASYRSFVAGLGWQIDLKTFPGFTGKLEDCGSDGTSCPYFADDGLELVFHEATSMPNSIKEPRQLNKKRHIGNDHVHIIWNESRHTYRPETISGDFGNVQIQIRPLKPGEYGISIYCDEQIRPFGPLVDGMVISADVLPAAVRATAISGHRRAVQAFFKTFIHPYVIRQQNINRIVEKYIDSKWLRTMFKEEEWI